MRESEEVFQEHTRVYIDGTCRLYKISVSIEQSMELRENMYLKTMTIWPFEETGFAFSRYAVKLSSRQRTSACVEPGGNLGDLGELGVVCEAVATMLHIGQPAFGANEAMLIDSCSQLSCE